METPLSVWSDAVLVIISLCGIFVYIGTMKSLIYRNSEEIKNYKGEMKEFVTEIKGEMKEFKNTVNVVDNKIDKIIENQHTKDLHMTEHMAMCKIELTNLNTRITNIEKKAG